VREVKQDVENRGLSQLYCLKRGKTEEKGRVRLKGRYLLKGLPYFFYS
jgi:hypothetical protein